MLNVKAQMREGKMESWNIGIMGLWKKKIFVIFTTIPAFHYSKMTFGFEIWVH